MKFLAAIHVAQLVGALFVGMVMEALVSEMSYQHNLHLYEADLLTMSIRELSRERI